MPLIFFKMKERITMNIKRTALALFLIALMVLGLVACNVSTPTTAANDKPAGDTVTVLYRVNGETYTSQNVVKGQKTTAPTTPAVAGCEFVCWYVENDSTQTAFDFENTVINELTILVAKFSYITYNITYTVTAPEGMDVNQVKNPNMSYYSSGDLNPASKTSFTAEKDVVFSPATVEGGAFVSVWVDDNGNVITSTKGITKDLHLTTRWSKAPYLSLDFEGAKIHYNDLEDNVALDGTKQIYNNASGKASRPNLEIQSYYDVDENGNIKCDFTYRVMDSFKNTHNPSYIRNESTNPLVDAGHGDYFCIVLDHDLTDNSQGGAEKFYYDKDGSGFDHAKDGVYAGVYYNCASNEHYNVSALCYLQNKNVHADGNKKVVLSVDFYFEEGGIFPISFYIRNESNGAYGAAFDGKRTNLAALDTNGDICIGLDAAGKTGRMSYKDGDTTITTKQVLGTANAGQWNTIAFIMTLNDTGDGYTVDIVLNGTTIRESLNLYVADLIWGNADELMIFGGGGSYAVDALQKDLVYKFDNIKLVDYDDYAG